MHSTESAQRLGLDVGGTSIKWARMQGEIILESGQVPTPREGGARLVALIGELARDLAPEAVTVGLAVPGLVDIADRTTVFIPNIPGEWNRYPLGLEVEEIAQRPVSIINDARAFGHGELLAGAGRGHPDVAFLVVGTGVGGAIARGGRVLMGAVDSLGELGHMTVEPHGERCGCGARGCLETVASGSAIVASVTRATLMSLSVELTRRTAGSLERLTPELIAAAALAGDSWSRESFERAGHYLGIAAGNAAVLLRLTTVIVGGGLAAAFPLFAPAMQAVLDERAELVGPISLLPAQLGSIAGAAGAALFSGIAASTPLDTLQKADT
jgi:glucokinase